MKTFKVTQYSPGNGVDSHIIKAHKVTRAPCEVLFETEDGEFVAVFFNVLSVEVVEESAKSA